MDGVFAPTIEEYDLFWLTQAALGNMPQVGQYPPARLEVVLATYDAWEAAQR